MLKGNTAVSEPLISYWEVNGSRLMNGGSNEMHQNDNRVTPQQEA